MKEAAPVQKLALFPQRWYYKENFEKGVGQMEVRAKEAEQTEKDRADELPESGSSLSMLMELLAEMRLG